MCEFTCRKNDKECSIEDASSTMQDTNEQAHSYPSLYTVFKPCKDGLKPDGTWIKEFDESIVAQFSDCSRIVVNHVSKELLVVNEVDLSGIEHELVLNLNDDGERWQGDVLEDSPFGWGVLYDSDNRKVYEGFRIGDVNVCYGRSYYPDIQKVEYEGVICEGRRCGRGVQYDRNGDVVIEGEWIADAELKTSITISEESAFLHSRIEELIVSDSCCNGEEWKVLDFTFMPYLRDLHIGDYCFRGVDAVILCEMNNLERVVIGSHCFSTMDEFVIDPEHIITTTHMFLFNNCKSVRELLIGNASFRDYSICKIESNPLLEKIEFGSIDYEVSVFIYSTLLLRGMLFQSVVRC